ncbi:HlyD family secretion protein [Niabella ginsengisoli]|uniref:HlyD family secretion protein n=1 Tax=Niabella ginsengisoli TaxID=522298 RepID=A0ABS9SK78_9BACT|nr:HlyD family secretion protein [Niabella ginsengisoli]MCH5598755.1 HlyD family secretion protein [Niabella ginsengisoli]
METKEQVSEQPKEARKKKSPVFFIILIAMLIVGGYFSITRYIHSKSHEETDDAQVEANLSPVISKISGYISEVRVKDNQFVHKGDTLLILDKRDLKLALEQAEAALGTARSNLASSQASTAATNTNIGTANAAIATADAQIEAAKVNVWRTSEDFKRYENLIKDHSITQQQYEQALAAKQTAEKQLQVLIAQKNQATAQTSVVKGQVSASAEQASIARSSITQREVEVENAKLNLGYTIITAAESGVVSKVPVQVGQFIQAGAQLFSVVLNDDKWVIANFKETQVSKMVEGQKVSVKVDAFPKKEFDAVLTSFSPATGARFALLPPDNASGNFVKVVQRLPVKIEFNDKNDSLLKKLRPGMNVVVDVHLN